MEINSLKTVSVVLVRKQQMLNVARNIFSA
jgi:hypothetical protein